MWIGTHGAGLYRYAAGKFVSITSENGLYDNLAFSLVEDDAGNLWMSGNKGIYRAALAELDDFAEGRRTAVNSFAYGSNDGMLSRECNGANPAGIKTSTGKLWFPTIRGVAEIDPRIKFETPPNTKIEQILIDDKIFPLDQSVTMNPAQDNLEIGFTALSWNRPPQIRFKYQLVGLDKDWVEAGTRRIAYYPHIKAGEYTFRVIADNGEGVWSEQIPNIKVVVLPPFYRTAWFIALCLAAVVLAVRFAYGYRLAQIEKISAAKTAFTQQLIEYQEEERKRVAIELHDSIGQSLIVIRNRALMALKTPAKTDRLIYQIEEISAAAADSINEVRQISHNLHPYQLEHLGLTTALETMIEAVASTSTIVFEKNIDDLDGVLTKEAEINLYRIVQESVNNILKHSEATRVKISIYRNPRFVTGWKSPITARVLTPNIYSDRMADSV